MTSYVAVSVDLIVGLFDTSPTSLLRVAPSIPTILGDQGSSASLSNNSHTRTFVSIVAPEASSVLQTTVELDANDVFWVFVLLCGVYNRSLLFELGVQVVAD